MKVILLAAVLFLCGCVSDGSMPINTSLLGSGLNNAVNYAGNSIKQPQSMQSYDATITRLHAQRIVGYGAHTQPWNAIQGDTFRMAPIIQQMGYTY